MMKSLIVESVLAPDDNRGVPEASRGKTPRLSSGASTSLLTLIVAAAAFAQPPMKLTLREAEDLALRNHPLISAAGFQALASGQVTTEVRSAYLPTIYGNFTSGGAINNSRIQAGGFNNPIIYNRVAAGFSGSQLIADFGRTASLVESSKLRTESQEQLVKATRAQVVLIADRAYYSALRAAAVLRVAQQTVASRQLTADQVTALADSKLKSGLDVSFTNVNLAEAKLLLSSAQNQQRAAYAELAGAGSCCHSFVRTRGFDAHEN